MSIGVNHEMEGQSAMMPLGASAGAPVECDTTVPSEAAQGNPRIEGVSCAAYLFCSMSMRPSEGDFNEKQLVSQ